MMKRTSLFLDEKLISEATALYDSQSDAMSAALDSFVNLRKRALYEIKNKLEKAELIAICDAYNGTIMERNYFSFSHFEHQMTDAEKFESSCTKHGADLEKLLKKCKELGIAELFFLLEEINRFWNVQKAFGSPAPDLVGFINTYAKA